MKPALPFLLIVVMAALGFATGRHLGSPPAPGGGSPDVVKQQSSATKTAPAHASSQKGAPPMRLPTPAFADQTGLDAYVAALKKLGVGESLAKWMAISAKVNEGLPASFALAKKADLEREWAVAAALSDPEGALELLRTLPSTDLFSMGMSVGPMGVFFQTLGRANPALGMELLPRLSGLGAAAAASAFFGSWAKTNSSAAMNAAASIEPRAVRESAMEGLLREWGGRDPHAMMKWASGKDKPTAKLAFRSLFQMRGPRNPAVVLELAREFPDAAEPFVLTNTAGDLVAQGAEGWKSIADFPQGTLRDGMVRWFATRFSEMDPKAAWELAKSLSPEDRKIFVNWSTIREFAKIAPEESAKFVLASDPADRLHISEVISAWADKDPQAAFAWSAQNLKGPEMPSSLGSALFQWAKHDPAAALAAADDLAPGMRAQLLSNVLTSWGQSDPRKAFDFAKQMPGIDRDRAMENVIKGWSYADPVAAAGALAAMPSVGLGGAFDSVAWQLGDKDPAFGFNWAEGLSEAGTGASAVQKITEDWGKKDASAASDRISKLKTGEFRDHAIQGLVESIRNLDPDSAAAWADSIGGPDARAKTLRTVVDNWRATDHAAAQTFVTGMAPGSLKTEMQRLLDSKSSPDEPFIR